MTRCSLACWKLGFMNFTFHMYFPRSSFKPIIRHVTNSMIVFPTSVMSITPCLSMTTTHTPVCGFLCFSVR